MACICKAISSCGQNLKCDGDVCGVFRITWAYWTESGSRVLDGDDPFEYTAFENCANNITCAQQSVIGYMENVAKDPSPSQDCNNDGVIDCYDYASIHYLGPYNCRANLVDWYKKSFQHCYKDVSSETTGSENNNPMLPNNKV